MHSIGVDKSSARIARASGMPRSRLDLSALGPLGGWLHLAVSQDERGRQMTAALLRRTPRPRRPERLLSIDVCGRPLIQINSIVASTNLSTRPRFEGLSSEIFGRIERERGRRERKANPRDKLSGLVRPMTHVRLAIDRSRARNRFCVSVRSRAEADRAPE